MSTAPKSRPAGESSRAERPKVSFDPPGPGCWQVDTNHQSHARGRLMGELFDESFTEGFREMFARYGIPLETIECKSVHGWTYTNVQPVGAPEGGGKPPPNFVLKVATRLVPELRRRNRTARQAIGEKRWLVDASTWATERPSWISEGTKLLADPLAESSDTEVEAHVRACVDLVQRMLRRHFALVGAAVATGRLLVAAQGWGFDQSEVLRLLRGASPASAATVAPLCTLAEHVAATNKRPTTVAELAALSPEIAQLVQEYLHTWGWRVLGDDIETPFLMDDPNKLIDLVAAASTSTHLAGAGYDDDLNTVRAQLPSRDRERFDELVAEARQSYGSLDDNSGITCWVIGIARRAVLEVGRRAVQSERLRASPDVWNLSIDELFSVAGGSRGPADDTLADRVGERDAACDPPAWLGTEPGPPPSAGVFPAPMGEMVAAFGAFMASKFGNDEVTSGAQPAGQLVVADTRVASGHGVGTEPATGRVIVADTVPEAMDRLRPGDILVCSFTTAAWNSIFPLLGGIVTAHGGPVSHAGVMAREFGLSALVGIGTIQPQWDGQTATLRPTVE